MSNNPFSTPGQSGLPPAYPQRGGSLPGIILAIAILGLLLGGWNLLGNCCGIAGMTFLSSSVMDNVMKDAAKQDPAAAKQFAEAKAQIQANMVPLIGSMAMSMLAGLGIVIGSIGILMRKEWGRNLFTIACFAGMLAVVLSIGLGVFINMNNAAEVPADQQAIQMASQIFAYAFSALQIVYYIFGWKILSSPGNRGYFS